MASSVIDVTPIENQPRLATDDLPFRVAGYCILFLAVFVFGLWAVFAPLEGAVVASGKVTVESFSKLVQHLEGGIVKEILVKDGDRVEAGTPLIILDDTQSRAELEIVRSRLFLALAQRARLMAEQAGASHVTYPQELLQQASNPAIKEVMDAQTHQFLVRKASLESQISVLEQRIAQLKEQIQGIESMVVTHRSLIASYTQEVEEWERLLQKQMVDKLRLRDAQRRLDELKGQLAANLSDIARLKVQITETQEQIILQRQKFLEDVLSQMREQDAIILDARSRINSLEDRLKRTVILSPVAGVVTGLRIYTVGAVIRPGDVLMEIVPASQSFIIESYIQPTDINHVHEGLLADIRFSAFSSRTTHVVEGKVIHVSADVTTDPQTHHSSYVVRIQLTPNGVEMMRKDGMYMLQGMPAEVFIKTEKRTFWSYISRPLTDRMQRALREH